MHLLAEARFTSQGRSGTGWWRGYLAELARVTVRLEGVTLFWKKCVGLINKFVIHDDEPMREVPNFSRSSNRRTHSCMSRRVWGALEWI